VDYSVAVRTNGYKILFGINLVRLANISQWHQVMNVYQTIRHCTIGAGKVSSTDFADRSASFETTAACRVVPLVTIDKNSPQSAFRIGLWIVRNFLG